MNEEPKVWLRLRTVSRLAWEHFVNYFGYYAAAGATVYLLLLFVFIGDSRILHAVIVPESDDPQVMRVARIFSKYGDIYYWTFGLGFMIWLIAQLRRLAYLRDAALVCVLSAILAGLFVDVLKPIIGRPRPSLTIADGVYPFSTGSAYHGFPSGHSATSWATAASLAVAVPPIGVPCFGIAVAVSWSRMQLFKHHLSDVIAGAFVGVVFGTAYGWGLRRFYQK